MSVDTRSKQLRRRKKIVPAEPVKFERIAMTIPKDLLKEVDYVAQLYRRTRSSMIQSACNWMVEDLVRVDWIREIFQEKGVQHGQAGYDVDKLISSLFESATPGPSENTFQLTPPQLEFVKGELEKARGESKKSKWTEFCEKCKCDPEKIASDRPTVLVPLEELVG
jgi:hypothetical protein